MDDGLVIFRSIRIAWLAGCLDQMALSADGRASLDEFLNGFASQAECYLKEGAADGLRMLLERWSGERTLSDLEKRSGILVQIIQLAYGVLLQIARRQLGAEEGLLLMTTLQPFFSSASLLAVQLETNLIARHFARELEENNRNLEKLDRSKSDFIAIAAHELRTPLTLVEGYLAMIKEKALTHEILDELQVLFDGMDNGARRLRQIIEDMVDVSLIDNQMLSLNFQPMRLSRILDELQREFGQVTRERQQVLDINPFPESGLLIYADESRLYQAFRNLVSNAIKYTPDGGKISISGQSLPGFVDVKVQDTGIGILPENQTAIFEKFGRQGDAMLHTSSKTGFKGGGPGLGLPIAKGIISAHGGAIWVESETCDEVRCPGSTFHVVLPLNKTPPDQLSEKLFSSLSKYENDQG